MTRRLALLLTLTTGCRAAPLPEAERFPAGTRFAARQVRVDDTRIRYIDVGEGPPVILIHGLGASLYAWRNNLDPLATAGFRVVAYDNRGFGWSDKPTHGYTNGAYAQLLVALMDSLRIADAVLVGHSMGGAIAAETALRYPKRVRGLVLIGAAGLGTREPTLFRVARWPVVGPVLLSFRGRGLVERLLKSTYADPSKVTDADVDQYYAPVADPGYGPALRAVLREFRFDGLGGRLDRIEAPTLVLWGEADRWVPIALGRALASQLVRSAFLSVPRAGHGVQEEAPAEVNRLLIKFLKEGLPRIPENLAWSTPSSRHGPPPGRRQGPDPPTDSRQHRYTGHASNRGGRPRPDGVCCMTSTSPSPSLHASTYASTGTVPYNRELGPILISEWHELAYQEITELTMRGLPGVWTHDFDDGWVIELHVLGGERP